ncbi:MAG: argininosuccinate synthase [Candidatus Poribacteria bacterium]|nr:argininosuccinate synthase [Candidatus Poribacteria bacterium]
MKINQLKGRSVGIAVSGGLDSCTITRWLVDHGVDVFCFTADLGQPDEKDMNEIRNRMLNCGALDSTVVVAVDQLAEAGLQLIQAQATYEGGYWNTTGIARHVTVAVLLESMKKRGITILSHGSTGRGNDQVRFQLATNMIEPNFEVYAPWRDEAFLEQFGGRKEMIDFCNQNNIPITATYEKPYSTDANLLGLTHEAGKLESLQTPANFITPGMGLHPKDAPDKAEHMTIRFEKGRPTEINGKLCSLVEAFELANEIGGRNGVGIGIHVVENRFVGIKSRGVYESPGMEVLGQCYEYLLQLILDRRSRRVFNRLSDLIAEQIYEGYWFDPATQSQLAALQPFKSLASGKITVTLYKGNISFHSAVSIPHSLYSEETASMEDIGDFNHADSEGFLSVLGVSAKALAVAKQIDETL